MHWHRLSRGVMKSLSLDAFKKLVAVALRDMVGGHGGDRLIVGLDRGLPDLNDSMKYKSALHHRYCFLETGNSGSRA